MELLPSGLSHNPFPKEDAPLKLRRNPLALKELCRRAIIALSTLRGLKGADIPQLPPILRRRIMTLKVKNFVKVDMAAFMDTYYLFAYFWDWSYHVRCSFDGAEYMATHGGTCSLSELSQDFRRWQWIQLMHANIMCIYAVAYDQRTSNLFFIMDVPDMTLLDVEYLLATRGLCFPEHFIWKVAQQLASAIMYVEERQLSFGRFGYLNMFVIQKRIVLDNKLTWKSSTDLGLRQNRVQSVMLGDRVSTGWHDELQTNSPSEVSVVSLGIVLERLASFCLRPPRCVLKSAVAPSEMLDDLPVFDGFKPRVPEGDLTYSLDLMDLLASFRSTSLPPLAAVHAKALEMMMSIEANRRI